MFFTIRINWGVFYFWFFLFFYSIIPHWDPGFKIQKGPLYRRARRKRQLKWVGFSE